MPAPDCDSPQGMTAPAARHAPRRRLAAPPPRMSCRTGKPPRRRVMPPGPRRLLTGTASPGHATGQRPPNASPLCPRPACPGPIRAEHAASPPLTGRKSAPMACTPNRPAPLNRSPQAASRKARARKFDHQLPLRSQCSRTTPNPPSPNPPAEPHHQPEGSP